MVGQSVVGRSGDGDRYRNLRFVKGGMPQGLKNWEPVNMIRNK